MALFPSDAILLCESNWVLTVLEAEGNEFLIRHLGFLAGRWGSLL